MKRNHDHNNCINKAIKNANDVCKKNFNNLTDLRKRVLEIILSSKHKAIKAYDILEKLKNDDFSNAPPTVYRALDFLIENKIIHKINSINAYFACYEKNKTNQCYFIICKKCSAINEYKSDVINLDIEKIAKKSKAKINSVNLEIEVECSDCLKK